MRKKPSRKLNVLKEMPQLFHRKPGYNFSIANSEVIKWMISQPDIQQYVFDKASALGYIVFNSEINKWQGVDYK